MRLFPLAPILVRQPLLLRMTKELESHPQVGAGLAGAVQWAARKGLRDFWRRELLRHVCRPFACNCDLPGNCLPCVTSHRQHPQVGTLRAHLLEEASSGQSALLVGQLASAVASATRHLFASDVLLGGTQALAERRSSRRVVVPIVVLQVGGRGPALARVGRLIVKEERSRKELQRTAPDIFPYRGSLQNQAWARHMPLRTSQGSSQRAGPGPLRLSLTPTPLALHRTTSATLSTRATAAAG